MRVLIDANVLFGDLTRGIVLRVAATGRLVPLWSPRILEEWARAAARRGPEGAQTARAEIVRLRETWPEAEVTPDPDTEAGIVLPDPDDAHVLAAAVAGGAGEILTQNLRDFPSRVLARHGVIPRDPDGFLLEAWHADADGVAGAVEAAAVAAELAAGRALARRSLLKRAKLPRLGRALYA